MHSCIVTSIISYDDDKLYNRKYIVRDSWEHPGATPNLGHYHAIEPNFIKVVYCALNDVHHMTTTHFCPEIDNQIISLRKLAIILGFTAQK